MNSTSGCTSAPPREPGVDDLLTEIENLLPSISAAAYQTRDLADSIMGPTANKAVLTASAEDMESGSKDARSRLRNILNFLIDKNSTLHENLNRIY